MDKNGNWDFILASNAKEDIFIDQKILKRVIGDIKTEHLEMFKKHKPVIVGTMNNTKKSFLKKEQR